MPRVFQDILEELMINQDRRDAYNDWSTSRQTTNVDASTAQEDQSVASDRLRSRLTQVAKIIMKYDATDKQMNIAKRLYPDAIIIKEGGIDLD